MADDHDKYLFFSSQELISYFRNNLKEKDIKTQCRRTLEMARVFMAKKGFVLEDLYSVAVMVKDFNDCSQINEIFKLYFKQGRYPIRVLIQIDEMEDVSDLEMEFSAYKGEKRFINTDAEEIVSVPASQAVIIEDFVHTSGIGPLKHDSAMQSAGDLEYQARQCLENLKDILDRSGSSMERVYSVIVYMKNISALPQVEETFAEYKFSDQDISNRVIEVKSLENSYDIEISCSAYVNN